MLGKNIVQILQIMMRYWSFYGINVLVWASCHVLFCCVLWVHCCQPWTAKSRTQTVSFMGRKNALSILWHTLQLPAMQLSYILFYSSSLHVSNGVQWVHRCAVCTNIVRSGQESRPIKSGLDSSSDSRFAPSQWETALLCNDVAHWLDVSLNQPWDSDRVYSLQKYPLSYILCLLYNSTERNLVFGKQPSPHWTAKRDTPISRYMFTKTR